MFHDVSRIHHLKVLVSSAFECFWWFWFLAPSMSWGASLLSIEVQGCFDGRGLLRLAQGLIIDHLCASRFPLVADSPQMELKLRLHTCTSFSCFSMASSFFMLSLFHVPSDRELLWLPCVAPCSVRTAAEICPAETIGRPVDMHRLPSRGNCVTLPAGS